MSSSRASATNLLDLQNVQIPAVSRVAAFKFSPGCDFPSRVFGSCHLLVEHRFRHVQIPERLCFRDRNDRSQHSHVANEGSQLLVVSCRNSAPLQLFWFRRNPVATMKQRLGRAWHNASCLSDCRKGGRAEPPPKPAALSARSGTEAGKAEPKQRRKGPSLGAFARKGPSGSTRVFIGISIGFQGRKFHRQGTTAGVLRPHSCRLWFCSSCDFVESGYNNFPACLMGWRIGETCDLHCWVG